MGMMGKRLRRVWGESLPFTAGREEGTGAEELGKPPPRDQRRPNQNGLMRQQSASAYKLIYGQRKRRSNKKKT